MFLLVAIWCSVKTCHKSSAQTHVKPSKNHNLLDKTSTNVTLCLANYSNITLLQKKSSLQKEDRQNLQTTTPSKHFLVMKRAK